ncbi:sigma-70 family RNA polymerase sigma factor [Psychromonas sp. 14N.309.X.WAT.B.A12]|uniref:sigma-70 family RNA polymerase sigma factor n=1 Tax=unclassified Psychromonas TaxID=2614957 RepID=UPI0025B1DF40|nr:sigma-70 family RNA polymerase sigma factor [Psychromonas sp. 14N.309.X.WAT.B.A12]MDN2662225.1 sigma-70 family RNA polymerase sigma factor [Psychromonas sp. 14N.309.X.WAT.B.A12]
MVVEQTKLPTGVSHAKSNSMNENIDHTQLSEWLNQVADKRCKNAFTHLFKFFAPKIQRIARSKFPNEAQSHEVVQETMSNVWRKAHLFDANKGAATTWVYTVMRNVTFDLLRKVKSNREDNLSDDIWPIAEGSVTEEQVYEDHLESNQLLRVIEALPEAQQQVVKGFYLMEMSQEQLANHLNLPLGTIKSRLRLALAKLKVQLGEEHD